MHTLILLENDAVMRESVTTLVDGMDALQLVGVSTTAEGGYELLQKEPDFALVDIVLDDGLAYDFISHAASIGRTKILIVSVLGDEKSVISAIEAGAAGYIKKDATSAELLHAIEAVLRDEAPMSPTIARHLLRRVRTSIVDPSDATQPVESSVLSPREKQILEALAHGMNYKEVARKYDLSHHTVAKYIKTIYKKLSVNSRAEAVVQGLKSGVITIDKLH